LILHIHLDPLSSCSTIIHHVLLLWYEILFEKELRFVGLTLLQWIYSKGGTRSKRGCSSS